MKKIKLKDVILLIILILITYGSFAFVLFNPKLINNYENRTAVLLPKFTFSTFLSGEYQKQIEDALADQLPLTATTKKLYNLANSTMIHQTVNHFYSTVQYAPLGQNVYRFGQDYHLVDKPVSLEKNRPDLEKRALNINEYVQRYPNINFYSYYIERDVDVDFTKNNRVGISNYFLDLLKIPNENKETFMINDFQDYRNYFYKTDHHWNQKGSYKAYTEIIKMLKPNGHPLEKWEEICMNATFIGSRSNQIGADKLYKEPFCAYNIEIPPHKVESKEGTLQYGKKADYFNDKFKIVNYGAFYGNDAAEIEFTFDDQEGNVLIIGESYDNAIIDLIGSHYHKTYSIDLRHYQRVDG